MKVPVVVLLIIFFGSIICDDQALDEHYCKEHGGQVILMTASFDTGSGMVNGNKKKFCRIQDVNYNLGYIGLDTFGSKVASLAATYAKSITLSNDKEIKGPFETINLNLCYVLGGGNIVYFLTDGGYTDEYGQADICIFGDNSAVAAWTLYFMTLGARVDIKNAIVAKPLKINMPTIPFV
jgi:hypothetical protein